MSDTDHTQGDSASDTPPTLKAEILALYDKRTEIEAKMKEALKYLETTPVGMDKPLIDAEGFPRNDCDLYAIRGARNSVICGRNDLRAIDEALYEKLSELHGDTKEEAEAQMAADEAARRKGKAEAESRQRRMQLLQTMGKLGPLLSIASVEPNSPAAEAGFAVGWLIIQYGPLNADNLAEKGGLGCVADITKENEGKVLSVWVRENMDADTEPRELFIVPQAWSGKGLLGCALDPV